LISIASRKASLRALAKVLTYYKAPEELITIARRKEPLIPTPPPGAVNIVTTRSISKNHS
jgi:hypothetical protein